MLLTVEGLEKLYLRELLVVDRARIVRADDAHGLAATDATFPAPIQGHQRALVEAKEGVRRPRFADRAPKVDAGRRSGVVGPRVVVPFLLLLHFDTALALRLLPRLLDPLPPIAACFA